MEQNQQPPVNGRMISRRTEEEILKHLKDQESSDFSVKEYCEMFDIIEQTFYSWIKKYRPKPVEEYKGGFAPIEVVPTANEGKPRLFAEVGNIKIYKEVSADYLKTLLS